MLPSINKVHATTLSMNDRFTIIQKVVGRSLKSSQQVLLVSGTGATARNRSLLNQFEKSEELRKALKIKRKRLNTTPPAIRERRRSKNRESVAVASVAAFGANNLHRRLKRLNSVSKEIASLKEELLQDANLHPLRRSNSTSSVSIIDRLGVQGRAQSASRIRTNMMRSSSKQNLSQTRVHGRLASRRHRNTKSLHNQTQNRSSSRVRTIDDVQAVEKRRRRRRLNMRKVTPVIERLGVRSGGNTATQSSANTRARLGRIAKRRNSDARNQIINGDTQQTAGRSSSRTHEMTLRKRGNGKKQPQQEQQKVQNLIGQGTRGRSRVRRRRRGRSAKLEALKSKEDLDKELEQYMIDTKCILDHGSNSRNCD